MSGQYPPPNPFGGHHQRAPASPWAHSHPRHPQSHPTAGMVWSPHVGHPVRGAQMWTPKPVESRPLYGLQMMMGSPQYSQQQEETIDLSASAQDLPKTMGDPLRNGTINGETESIVTSVIATNPLREATSTDPLNCSPLREATSTDPLNCSKRVEETTKVQENSDFPVSVPEKRSTSSVLVPEEAAVELELKSKSNDLDRLSDLSVSGSFVKETEKEQSSQNLEALNSDVEDSDTKIDKIANPGESLSFLDSSCLSVDTDESRLVVAESSAEDIFGVSPVGNVTNSSSQDTAKSGCLGGVISSTSISDSSSPREQWPLKSELSALPPPNSLGPDPSVENVETLLESMFNSQEESCSSQISSSGVPQSVIVSNGARLPAEISLDSKSPMKEEELAKTLAEDTLTEFDIQEEDKIDVEEHKENIDVEVQSRSIKDEQNSSIENPVVPDDVPNINNQIKEETTSTPDLAIEDSEQEIKDESIESNLSTTTPEPAKEDNSGMNNEDVVSVDSNQEPSTSNPFIEVETQLEKMFAGIVEPMDEGSSDAQPLVIEATKFTLSKKGNKKRKKSNNRRSSDHSLFGGSSGESTHFNKKIRKRIRDGSGNERHSKKMKIEVVENTKKSKTFKENVYDALNSKMKGPFVHIEGSKENPTSVVVVNNGLKADDEDGVDKVSSIWKHSTRQKGEGGVRKAGYAYNSSTLSMRYNSDIPDATWVCVFCKRGPHCVGGLGGEPAGDLFGPYRVPMTPPNNDNRPPGIPTDQEISEEQKRQSGTKFPKSLRSCDSAAEHFVAKIAKKGRRLSSHDCLESQAGLLSVGESYEVWLHEQCAVWAPGICIIGSQVVGLDDTVWSSLRTKCWQCGDLGAGLGCVVHNCPTKMHYPCAKVCGWLLDDNTFIARCQTHRTRLRP